LSFDLDDTLYQNEEVIDAAEQAQFDVICELIPEAAKVGMPFWSALKWQVAKQRPEVAHDVTEWRYEVIRQGLAHFGALNNENLEQVFNQFYLARSNFTVPKLTFDVLEQLKQRFTLVTVTNGNADIERIGLGDYFAGYYRAGLNNCKMKPYPDMLVKVMQDFSVDPHQILHLGDNVGSDIQASINAKVPNFWFNPDRKRYPSGHVLPDAEYTCLSDLLQLLD
jgi:putative hydrolase of the HAD superfamily